VFFLTALPFVLPLLSFSAGHEGAQDNNRPYAVVLISIIKHHSANFNIIPVLLQMILLHIPPIHYTL
jgi:hypothetical protein